MLRFRKTAARPEDARTLLIDLEAAQRRDLYAAGRGDRPRRRLTRPGPTPR